MNSETIYVTNATSLLRDHPLADVEGQVGRSQEHDVDNGLERVGREPLGGRDEVPGGVVHDDVGQAEAIHARVDGSLDRRGVADVTLDRQEIAAGRGRYLGSGRLQHRETPARRGPDYRTVQGMK